jgi:hypothetical protein
VILKSILGWLTGGFVDKILDGWQAYLKKEISEAEFEARVKIAASEAAAKVEASWAQAAADTARATHDSLGKSAILQRAWASVLFLQITVLAFYQVGAPAFLLITGTPWPDPGVTLEYAYLLVGAMIGVGPLVIRK